MRLPDGQAPNQKKIWEELLAIVAMVLWSVQLIPQVYKNYKTKSTVGLSPWAFVMWAIANVLVGANSYISNVVVPIFVQPQLFCALSLVCLAQCYLYPPRAPPRPLWEGVLLLGGLWLFFASIEVVWINFILVAPWRHSTWFVYLIGSIGPIITSLGFLPQYYDIIRLKSTEGLSLLFIFLDLTGGAAALISLALHPQLEITVALMYLAVMTLEFGLLILHILYSKSNYISKLRIPKKIKTESRENIIPTSTNPNTSAIHNSNPNPAYASTLHTLLADSVSSVHTEVTLGDMHIVALGHSESN